MLRDYTGGGWVRARVLGAERIRMLCPKGVFKSVVKQKESMGVGALEDFTSHNGHRDQFVQDGVCLVHTKEDENCSACLQEGQRVVLQGEYKRLGDRTKIK